MRAYMYALCVSGSVNMRGPVWKFFCTLYINSHSFMMGIKRKKRIGRKVIHWTSACLPFPFFHRVKKQQPLVEFTYRIFTCMPGESYSRWLRSLLLCLCDAFQLLINSFVCCFHKVVATILPFFLSALSFSSLFLGFFFHQHGWNLYIILPQ